MPSIAWVTAAEDPLTFDIKHMTQAIVTVLAVINPVVCGSIFLTLTQGLSPSQKRTAAAEWPSLFCSFSGSRHWLG